MNQRIKASRRFAMHPNASVRSRSRPDKPFMKSVGWREFAPISHRITGVRLAHAAFGLVLVDNCKMSGWRFGSATPDIGLRRHQQTVAFHDINGLRAFRESHSHFRRIVRFVGHDVIRPSTFVGGSASSGFATGEK